MKNLKRTRNAQVTVALPVTAGLLAGATTKLGANGLRGVLITDRATAATIADGTSAPGLKDGEATCELLGVHITVKVPFAAAIAQFAPVYIDAATSAYTATAAGNTQIGVTLEALAGAGVAEVALF